MPESFCFIFDEIEYKGELPVEIIPGHFFRKATSEEIEHIKQALAGYSLIMPTATAFYELKRVPTSEDGTSWKSTPLPPEDWKYYIISFDGYNDNIKDLRYAADLLKHDINLGFEFLYTGSIDNYGMGDNRYISSQFFIDRGHKHHQKLTTELDKDNLIEIQTNFDCIKNLDKNLYGHTYRALSNFHDIKMITERSLLRVLSYFSIIEGILTHDPIDQLDALNRQIRTKMSLLSKRFQRTLDYELHFPQLPKKEEVWKRLYNYRSRIAHGTEIRFDGDLQSLVSNENIQKFLEESSKLLLLYALKEPEFITDFQRC